MRKIDHYPENQSPSILSTSHREGGGFGRLARRERRKPTKEAIAKQLIELLSDRAFTQIPEYVKLPQIWP